MFTNMSRIVPPDQKLAATVRRLREGRDETQEDVAHKTGITVGSFARIERGESNPALTTVESIAAALGMSPAQLVEAVEDQEI
jgi:transcriptional regulator with XRE-family HTH domain